MGLLRISAVAFAFMVSPVACAQDKHGRWSTAALSDLVQVAASAPEQGLPSEAVATSEIRALMQQGKRDAAAAARLQTAADALYARLAQSFAQGATDPAIADPEWRVPRAEAMESDLIWRSAAKNSMPSDALLSLLPTSNEYEVLQQEFVRVSSEPDGAVDGEGRTREDRLVSLRASLERWRWLPRGLGATRVEARLPHFEVVLFRQDEPPAGFNAIVGARRTQTPAFAGTIDGVILNPSWTPPRSILVNELVPQMRRDAGARSGYDVIDSRGRVVDPASVDWAAQPFPYQLRQPPGPQNALGRIKFDMRNPYDVYMHDTPSRSLFERDERALSHGCIRVERPVELAAALLAPAWDTPALEAAIAEGATQTVPLQSTVPFYALYITASAWDGEVRYADDVYHRDARIVAALDAPDLPEAASVVAATSQVRCPV